MEKQILLEIKELRNLLSKIVGTSDLPDDLKFSTEALDKAAQEFRSLSKDRGEWVRDISEVIKEAPYNSGKFIVERLKFTNFFIRGKTRYFNRKDLLALKNELQQRNINLRQYMELVEDQDKFRKYVESIGKRKAKEKPFAIPENLKNVSTPHYALPPIDNITNHLAQLLNEYHKHNLSTYVDLYEDKTYAMFKSKYHFNRYYDEKVMKTCRKWVSDFNFANYSLKEYNRLKEEQ